MFALKGMATVFARTKELIVEYIPHQPTNVANCTVGGFVVFIAEHFNCCYVPPQRTSIFSLQLSYNSSKNFFAKRN